MDSIDNHTSHLYKPAPITIPGDPRTDLYMDLVTKNITQNDKIVSEQFAHCAGATMRIHFDFGSPTVGATSEVINLSGTTDLCTKWSVPANPLVPDSPWLPSFRNWWNDTFEKLGIDPNDKRAGGAIIAGHPFLVGFMMHPPDNKVQESHLLGLFTFGNCGYMHDWVLEHGGVPKEFTESPGGPARIAKFYTDLFWGGELDEEEAKKVGGSEIFLHLCRLALYAREEWPKYFNGDERSYLYSCRIMAQTVITEGWESDGWGGPKQLREKTKDDFEWGPLKWFTRTWNIGIMAGWEYLPCFWGFCLPDEVRIEPMWIYLQHISCILAAIYQDIASFWKESEERTGGNVLIRKSLKREGGGQAYYTKLMTTIVPYLIAERKGCRRKLLGKFPHIERLDWFIDIVDTNIDCCILWGFTMERYMKHIKYDKSIRVELILPEGQNRETTIVK